MRFKDKKLIIRVPLSEWSNFMSNRKRIIELAKVLKEKKRKEDNNGN
tara:strand:- start:2 stop:142 length:141 start_codon:yes stop_codon:yes gene_type:complete